MSVTLQNLSPAPTLTPHRDMQSYSLQHLDAQTRDRLFRCQLRLHRLPHTEEKCSGLKQESTGGPHESDRDFKHSDQIKQEILLHISCQYCRKRFYSTSALKRHLLDHTEDRPYKCDQCELAYTRMGNLRRHCLYAHVESKPRDDSDGHSCQYCSRSFPSEAFLKMHVRIHTGTRPFVCEHCHKAFTQMGYLQKHRLCHDPEREAFHCHFCKNTYSSSFNLKRHLGSHTGERPFKCELCGKAFKRLGHLQKHTHGHHRVQASAHSCQNCPKVFSSPHELQRHVCLRTEEEPCKCERCVSDCKQTEIVKTESSSQSQSVPGSC
ncbi:unnamed protein product [Knipowitschia caucasica]|uniref:C2H2-type domain-containing protein n=1 Tax=Knipowitschia caucasica TaxID=637954 RepID=A0AAV2JV28_KNICA